MLLTLKRLQSANVWLRFAIKMYRKYSNSTKYSRNERLAQLTEQESVIERKKREIQAKIEAQRKKDAAEVLKKLESSNSSTNYNFLPAKKQNWNKKEKDEEDEVCVACPKNAFSNDGSFLDHFKKLSNSDLGPKGTDISTLIRERKIRVKEKEHCKQIEKNQIRNENFDQQKDNTNLTTCSSVNIKFQDSNIQLHLPPPGVVQLVPHHHVPVTMPQPSALNNTQNEIISNDEHLQTGSSSCFSDTCYTSHQLLGSQFASTENSVKNVYYQNSCKTSVSTIEPPPPMKPQNIPPPNPIQVHNIPPPPIAPQILDCTTGKQLGNTTFSKEKNMKKGQKENSHEEFFAKSEDSDLAEKNIQKNKLKDEGVAIHFTIKSPSQEVKIFSSSETAFSSTAVESTRISPALSDEDVDYIHMNETIHSTQAASRQGRRSERSPSVGNLDNATSRYSTVKHQLILRNESEGLFDRNQHGNASDSDERSNSSKRRKRFSEYDSSDSDSTSRDSFHIKKKNLCQDYEDNNKKLINKDGYQADCEDESNCLKTDPRRKKILISKTSSEKSSSIGKSTEEVIKTKSSDQVDVAVNSTSSEERKRKKKKSRWGEEIVPSNSLSTTTSSISVQLPPSIVPLISTPAAKTPMLSKLTRSDPGLIQYAKQAFGSTNLSEEDWKKAEDHYKINLLYQDMVKKRAEIDNLEKAGKFKYEYDSDEDVEGGTWEHKLRQQEMLATQLWAEELTKQAAGKHHIGDFLPPEELERFMEKYNAVKEGRKPDLSDYKEFKLKEDNVGYRLLQKMGWNEGQGLGQDGTGIIHPVNKAATRHENQGLGIDRPDGLEAGDDEYDAYRKRMMLAYRFRPNPLNNPRRPYY